ncbi:MAG TPA: PilZ domain-containing protein [Polyangia bacterium]|nr:PilZ domain-containing protein [Polyangia bacterium]
MADDRSRKLSGAVPAVGSPRPPSSPNLVARDPRAAVAVPVRYRYQSFLDFVETQSMNVSRSGMFIGSKTSVPIGTPIDFEFALADGFPLLRGTGEVTRISTNPPGVGVRFDRLDEPSRKLIDRIVEINAEEGKQPTVALDFAEIPHSGSTEVRGQTAISPGVEFNGRDLHIEINPGTAAYFTNNPLLNIRLGGFVVPAPEDVPLGTMYAVTIYDVQRAVLWSGRGKVVAKHEARLGIRLSEVPKDVLARLQAEVMKAAPAK